jgi:hypothetical protein
MVDLTTIIALYGAGLATVLGVLELYRFRIEQAEKKPRVEVTVSTGFLSQGPTTSPAMLVLEAANSGSQPVTLNGIPSLLLPDKQKVILLGAESDVEFPHELLPGKKCTFWRDIKKLASSLKTKGYSGQLNVVGEFKDAIGNSYKSKSFPFDIEDWAK